MKQTRNSFVFYRGFYDVLQTLDLSDKIELLNMICEFGLNHQKIPTNSKLLSQIFTLIEPQVEANYQKAIAGRKGGRPKNNL